MRVHGSGMFFIYASLSVAFFGGQERGFKTNGSQAHPEWLYLKKRGRLKHQKLRQ